MSNYLLLGAGFSRNWGGWLAVEVFEYLLGSPQIMASPPLRNLLWTHQLQGTGFEGALAALQDTGSHTRESTDVDALTSAVQDMFQLMNRSLIQVVLQEISNPPAVSSLRHFLSGFDAVFTLNQDVFLESVHLNRLHYDPTLDAFNRWKAGAYCPGVAQQNAQHMIPGSDQVPLYAPNGILRVEPGMQPIFKLHGSSNWRSADNSSLLILGGAKSRNISASPLLSWYSHEFHAAINGPGARLMIIGYGFQDEHINAEISAAVHRGLKFFVNAPSGADLAASLNKTRGSNQITAGTSLEDVFATGLIGASRRGLRDVLLNDSVEWTKFERFLA